MDPVEHHPSSITEVPVEAGGDVVVLSLVDLIEIEVRITCLQLPRTWTDRTRHHEEVGVWYVASELRSVLTNLYVDLILLDQKIAEMSISTGHCLCTAGRHVDI